MTEDVTILYQGGSGGFALYYYLLLTGRFQHSTEDAWKKIQYQFDTNLVNSPGTWKTRELGVNNVALKEQPGPRLFLICNPLWNDHMIKVNHAVSYNTHKILLYTPFRLQLRMAWEKRAYWFTDVSRQAFSAPDSDQAYIRWIKQSTAYFKDTQVDPWIPDIISEFHPNVILSIKELLSGPATPDQRKFLDLWISLQPKKALHLMQL
jgi:hypothetical protein